MNKNDLLMILILVIIIGITFVFMRLSNQGAATVAQVYYDNDIVLTIDLSDKSQRTYEVTGYNGQVKIKAKDGKVKVIEEVSPLHICSKQGYISKSYETIVCLPNKIVITIEANDDYDVIVE